MARTLHHRMTSAHDLGYHAEIDGPLTLLTVAAWDQDVSMWVRCSTWVSGFQPNVLYLTRLYGFGRDVVSSGDWEADLGTLPSGWKKVLVHIVCELLPGWEVRTFDETLTASTLLAEHRATFYPTALESMLPPEVVERIYLASTPVLPRPSDSDLTVERPRRSALADLSDRQICHAWFGHDTQGI